MYFISTWYIQDPFLLGNWVDIFSRLKDYIIVTFEPIGIVLIALGMWW